MNGRPANLQNLESLQQHFLFDNPTNNVHDEVLLCTHWHTKSDFDTIEGVFAWIRLSVWVPHGSTTQTKKITHHAGFGISVCIYLDFYWFYDEKMLSFPFGGHRFVGWLLNQAIDSQGSARRGWPRHYRDGMSYLNIF